MKTTTNKPKTVTKEPQLPIVKKTTDLVSYRMGHITGLTPRKMIALLGTPNSIGDVEKTRWEWEFFFNDVRCMVWDYKGSYTYNTWSYYEEKSGTIKELFSTVKGAEVVSDDELFIHYKQMFRKSKKKSSKEKA